ncbi:hypothetical protein KCU78_g820, partial [Aureobasidium melanogenum]
MAPQEVINLAVNRASASHPATAGAPILSPKLGPDPGTGTGAGSGITIASAPTSTSHTATGVKRSRYVSRACTACQQRKVKCSGEQPGPCQNCQNTGLECVYHAGPRKRRTTRPTRAVDRTSENDLFDIEDTSEGQQSLAAQTDVPVQDLLSRLTKLESDLAQERMTRERTFQFLLEHRSGDALDMQKSSNMFVGSTHNHSLAHNIADEHASGYAGQFSVGHSDSAQLYTEHAAPNYNAQLCNQNLSLPTVRPNCFTADRKSLPACCHHDLMLTRGQWSADEGTNLMATVRRYFDGLASHYPCLNEGQTVAQLQSYFADQDSDVDPNVDTVQFVALIHLIEALQAIVEDDCTGEDELPGWESVQQASHLLAHTTWLANGNLLTIQCLIIKGLYLLAAQEYHASYGVVGEAVRLCYLTGLHVQSRKVSQSCRAPYFIRNCEIEVDLPACVDDKLIGGSEQLPDEDFDALGVPYLRSNVKWARLGGETWDKIFCVNANRPVDEEVIVTFDAKIENLRRRIPKKLQWTKDSLKVMLAQADSTRLAPLAMMLHLATQRANQLRLQLRQPENRLSSEFRNEDIGTSLALATDTTTIVHDFCFAMHMTNRDRFSCATYMQDAVKALANIILDSIVDENVFQDASASFNKALAVLQSLAPKFKAARRILEEFESLIRRVNDATVAHLPVQGRSNGHHGPGDLYAQAADIDTDHLGAATALHGLRSGTNKDLCTTESGTNI